MNPALQALLERETRTHALIDDVCGKVEQEDRNFNDAELTLIDGWKSDLDGLKRQIQPLQEIEVLRAEHEARAATARQASPAREARALGVTTEDRPIWRTAGDFMVDYLRGTPNRLNEGRVDARAADRIAQHEATLAARAVAHQTTADTPGLLPVNIVGQVLNGLDGARPFVQSIGVRPLNGIPGKTFIRPHVSNIGHTSSGLQTAEKTELPSSKLVIEPITFNKTTHGGSLNVSRQEIDYTSPAAWQAIIDDLGMVYAADTDDVAAQALAAAVNQSVTVASADIAGWVEALYAAAVVCLKGQTGFARATTMRLPTTIWCAADMWGALGAVLDTARGVVNIAQSGLGSGAPDTFAGTVLGMPRVMVPGLPNGTMIMGSSKFTEFYEERIGLLQAVQPSLLGIEIAVGGYIAYGTLDATVFCEIVGP